VTVSRDLRELGVAKLPGDKGRAYALKDAATPKTHEARLRRALREFAVSMEAAGQFIVVKTPPSGAQPVGLALDRAGIEEIAGTIAGDDTIFVLLRDAKDAPRVLKRLQSLAAGVD
jgi:transcriptional regulator of arginine metabolism